MKIKVEVDLKCPSCWDVVNEETIVIYNRGSGGLSHANGDVTIFLGGCKDPPKRFFYCMQCGAIFREEELKVME